MKSPLLALHDAQVERLENSTDRKVFDGTPENEPHPYITTGEMIARDWSDKFEDGQEVHSTLHVWSQYPGRKEVLEITDEIEQALTSGPLNLGNGFRAVVDELDSVNVIVDIDGVTRHGILTFRYLIEET